MYLRRLKSFFTALFTTGRAVDRALYRCVYRGDRTYGCGDIVFSVGDHRQKLVCTNSLGIKGLISFCIQNRLRENHCLRSPSFCTVCRGLSFEKVTVVK